MKLLGFLRQRGDEKPSDDADPAANAEAGAEATSPKLDFQKTLGRDQVTGLPNRPCFAHLAAAQSQLAARMETRVSLIILGWDEYEHAADVAARDATLAVFAARLKEKLQRAHDMLGSLGDGMFAVLLPFTDGSGAETVAKRLRMLLTAPPERPARPVAAPGDGESDEELDGLPPAPDAAEEPFVPPHFSVGVGAYIGKGALPDDALLAVAEKALTFARLNDGERLVRYDVAALSDREAGGPSA